MTPNGVGSSNGFHCVAPLLFGLLLLLSFNDVGKSALEIDDLNWTFENCSEISAVSMKTIHNNSIRIRVSF